MGCLYLALSETKGPRLDGLALVSIFLDLSGFSVLDILEDMMNQQEIQQEVKEKLRLKIEIRRTWKESEIEKYYNK